MIQDNSDVGADSNWGTTFRRGLENWGEGARVNTVLHRFHYVNDRKKLSVGNCIFPHCTYIIVFIV